MLALATACLGCDDRRAAALFAALGAEHDVREVWLGLATARLRMRDAIGAAEALGRALRRHVIDPGFSAQADAIARDAGAPGWCGLSSSGEPVVRPVSPAIAARSRRRGKTLAVTAPEGGTFLGSPIEASAILATYGCVRVVDGGLAGWAWCPGDPRRDPALTIRPTRGSDRIELRASDLDAPLNVAGLLVRPRGFAVPAKALHGMNGLLHVLDADGRDLLGSPLSPGAERAAVAAARPAATAIQASPRVASRRRPAADVVVPVCGGTERTLACLDSVLADLRRPSRLIVVDDASPEPDLVAALESLATRRRITLIRHSRNRGFAASANTGVRLAAGRDVVLLNSDTLVAPGWFQELRQVAYRGADIGTVTPLSNDASILSYPGPAGSNPVPDLAATVRLDALARRVNGGLAVDIPVGVGFCLYVRRDCLDAVGELRAELFAQGYGEENDFCLRARQLGWRNVAAAGAFVAHVGGQSFGAAAQHLRARNEALLERLHPGFGELVHAHASADPLAEARRRLDLARWRAGRRRSGQAVVLVTHAAGGGVERQIATSAARHSAHGYRAVVLRPVSARDGAYCVAVAEGPDAAFPNLRYRMPDELAALRRLLAGERPRLIEVHHTVGHHPAVLQLLEQLGAPYDMHVHDYAWLCGRVALVGPEQRYCGEPAVAQCEACVAKAGNLVQEDISVSALRARSARLMARARRVVVPSHDTAARLRRYFPNVKLTIEHHHADTHHAAPAPRSPTDTCRVCVVGAIGLHKGYYVILDCARDAAARRLPLEFVIVGHTIDDRALLATGRVFVTGAYKPDEVVALIKAQNATLALQPSIWPETWCLTLSEVWRAGLRVAAFDIGAPAERIRRTGRGMLLPLGMPTRAINDTLLAVSGITRRRCL